jgi:hypothetical protein
VSEVLPPDLPELLEDPVGIPLLVVGRLPHEASQDSTGRPLAVPTTLQRKLSGKTFNPAVLCKGKTKEGKPCPFCHRKLKDEIKAREIW